MKKHYFSAYAGLPRAVYVLFVARTVNSMGFFVAPLLTFILTQKLGLDAARAGSVVALLILTQAPGVLAGGKLADTVGRKRTMLAGSLAGAFFYLLCACGLSGGAMIACLILAADCSALAVPAAEALLADLTAPAQRQAAYSLLYLGINLGMAISPLLGGLLFQNHLALLFLLDAATTAAAVGLVAAQVPEPPAPQSAAAGGWTDGAPGLTMFAALRRAPVLTAFLLLLFFYDFCYSQWNFLLPAQFGERFGGDGARLYSALSSVNAVTVLLLTPLLTRLTRTLRPLRAVALAGLFYLAAYLGFGFGGAYAADLLAAVLFTLGEICSTIQFGAFVSTRAPRECLGRINAFSSLLRGGAGALGPLLMGRLLTVFGYAAGWRLTAAVVLAAAVGFCLLDRRDRPAGPQ